MKEDKYKSDGEEICCANCGLPAREYFETVGEPKGESWFNGTSWYCTNDCYEEYTKDEG